MREPSDTPDPDAADVLADLVDAGLQTLTFVSSRRGAELVALRAQKRLTTDRRVAAYRGGFLAHDLVGARPEDQQHERDDQGQQKLLTVARPCARA